MTPLDCADLRRRAQDVDERTVFHVPPATVLALLDLAARLKAALEQSQWRAWDTDYDYDVSSHSCGIDNCEGKMCNGCGVFHCQPHNECGVYSALTAAREAGL